MLCPWVPIVCPVQLRLSTRTALLSGGDNCEDDINIMKSKDFLIISKVQETLPPNTLSIRHQAAGWPGVAVCRVAALCCRLLLAACRRRRSCRHRGHAGVNWHRETAREVSEQRFWHIIFSQSTSKSNKIQKTSQLHRYYLKIIALIIFWFTI